ncbi:TetR/AcrR family transcriptional regulator [Sphingoaurantiacus capsulatus]|uniref:TetR/AcrR family transcriptional regulator n=1 Tax=Sphingoaurantiacus capsulatus TaxID=1771310 RepID=A0ABV7XG55_9SPHN
MSPPKSGAAKAGDETTQQRVLRAAVRLFAERGFHGTGIRDLAAAAELTTSTLYHYMTNKDDLLVEIMMGAITPLRDAAAAIRADIADPATALCAIVEHHVWAHASDRLATLVTDTELRALSGDRLKDVLTLRDEYEGLWRGAVEAGVEAGVFSTAHPNLAARALLQMATGVSHWFSAKGRLKLDELCRTYADNALALLRATDPDGKPLVRADLNVPSPTRYLSPLP